MNHLIRSFGILESPIHDQRPMISPSPLIFEEKEEEEESRSSVGSIE